MKREALYLILFDQQKDFERENPTVKREITSKVLDLLSLRMPIIITGIRRCGKSFLLKLIKEELHIKEKGYFYINFNDERLVDFSIEDFQKIIDFLNEQGYKDKCFLFIDEIQEAMGWEKWIDRIKNKYPICITGSNSKLLSKEISTVLTGRSINLSLTPFNFKEFLEARKVKIENWRLDLKQRSIIQREFDIFLQSGGIPLRVISGNDIIIRELHENILYRDIIKRFGKLVKQIKEISVYLMSNPSSLVSLRAVSKMVKIMNISTIKSILDSFENSFLFFFTNKFDYSIKKQIQNPRKAYCIDNGFLVNLGFRLSEDKGKLLENLVAIELKRKEKEIFYYSDKNECDFLIREGIRIVNAIQACYEINEGNKDREINGLLDAMNKFDLKEGLILTYNQEDRFIIKDKTIKAVPVWKWLLDQR